MRILVTATSFLDTPGGHHHVLILSGYEVVTARGPLREGQLLDLLAGEGFDGILCGDDGISDRVIDAAMPRLKVISKFGVNVDSIDVAHATSRGVPVLHTPHVNHTAVAEHVFSLLLALSRHMWPHLRSTKEGTWKRVTGTELADKRLALIGLGWVGKAVARRAVAFDMHVVAYDPAWDADFATTHGVGRLPSADAALASADVVSLHAKVNFENMYWLDRTRLAKLKRGALVINTANPRLVDEGAVALACKSGHLGGYATDVLNAEPPSTHHPFFGIDNILVTPHVATRTIETVERQGMLAVRNLVNYLTGDPEVIRAS